MRVLFIGAGPGDPELISVKGARILRETAVIIYAGSLVNPELLSEARGDVRIYDSSKMNLEEITSIYLSSRDEDGTIARLHTGDPSLYGAIQEQMDFCAENGIPYEVVPGISSFAAGAAAMRRELTLPGVGQTVILTRISGRTKTPPREALERLAVHGTTMVIFLSIGRIEEVVEKLKSSYHEDTPAAVVYRAGWPDQRICRATLRDIAYEVREADISRQALIYVGPVLASEYELSRLYDRGFSHGFRMGEDS